MEEKVKKQFCPICKTEVKPFPRYPKYLCHNCVKKAVSAEGRPLQFSNTTILGTGCKGMYADTNEDYKSNTCFVENEKCFAQEGRFGGIVIQPVEE